MHVQFTQDCVLVQRHIKTGVKQGEVDAGHTIPNMSSYRVEGEKIVFRIANYSGWSFIAPAACCLIN
jgi:hypothetical protein